MVQQMTTAERWRAIGMLESGMSIRAVAGRFGRSPETIRKLLVKSRETGSVVHASTGNHRLRSTTARADRRLLRIVKGSPTLPATLLRLMWGERSRRGNILSAQTIRRRIWKAGLRSRMMRKRPRLSPAHFASREQWAMQRIHWRQQQWRRVIFTDESRFRLFRGDGRTRVWREPRQEMLPQHVQCNEQQSASVHVWAGVTMQSKTELVFLDGNVTGDSYAELLQTRLLPFIHAAFGDVDNCILQDDNAPPHRAGAVSQLKEQLHLRTLRWPSRSPDMNPIEHVWDFLKRSIVRENAPQNVAQLRQVITDAWQRLPQDYLRRLVLGMPRRVSALLAARGGYTRY
jgi:transposase